MLMLFSRSAKNENLQVDELCSKILDVLKNKETGLIVNFVNDS